MPVTVRYIEQKDPSLSEFLAIEDCSVAFACFYVAGIFVKPNFDIDPELGDDIQLIEGARLFHALYVFDKWTSGRSPYARIKPTEFMRWYKEICPPKVACTSISQEKKGKDILGRSISKTAWKKTKTKSKNQSSEFVEPLGTEFWWHYPAKGGGALCWSVITEEKTKKTILSEVINKAIEASEEKNLQCVLKTLQQWADEKKPPFYGRLKNGDFEYEDHNGADEISPLRSMKRNIKNRLDKIEANSP